MTKMDYPFLRSNSHIGRILKQIAASYKRNSKWWESISTCNIGWKLEMIELTNGVVRPKSA